MQRSVHTEGAGPGHSTGFPGLRQEIRNHKHQAIAGGIIPPPTHTHTTQDLHKLYGQIGPKVEQQTVARFLKQRHDIIEQISFFMRGNTSSAK